MSGPSDEVQRDVLPTLDRPYEGERPLISPEVRLRVAMGRQ